MDSVYELDGRSFDAVVIGGGINGAAVARDAALRGISVCLFEKGDFAGGTSGKSTKIAHGGLRYLRNLEFGLVREAQQERHWLREALPHLVTPQSFCYPVYRGGADPFWKIRLGVSVYDLLDGRRSPHQTLSAARTLRANQALRPDGLQGALRYWDDRMDDARVCLETVLSAEAAGAMCFNYVRVAGVDKTPRGFDVGFEDARTGAQGTVHCRAIVNCGGPWADAVLQQVDATQRRVLRPTKGVHIVVPRIAGSDALVLDNPRDGRTFFAIPWDDQTLLGTTDTRYEGDPDNVTVEPQDVEYLLDAARHYVPGANISQPDVMYSFAGLRPLVAPSNAETNEGKISRRHKVIRGPSGVVTLIGGKFTTFRQMAEEAVGALLSELGLSARPSVTRTAPYFEAVAPRSDPQDDAELWGWLQGRYGVRAGGLYDLCLSSDALRRPVLEDYPVRLGELVFAVQHEKARTVSDLIERRTHLAWRREPEALASALAVVRRFVDVVEEGIETPGAQGSGSSSR